MSSYYGKMSDRMVEYIQNKLQYESYWKTRGYSWMKNYGYIKPMPEGILEILEHKILETEPANMTKDVEEFRDLKIQIEKKSYKIILLGRVLEFGLRDLQAWTNSSTPIGKETDLRTATIAEFQQKLYRQLDGFVFWGTNMRDAVSTDIWKGTDEITGFFNGFTAFGAGADEDNNVNAAMDYYISINNGVDDLVDDGYEADSYTIFSSRATKNDCDGGTSNHRNTTAGFKTELREVLAKPEVGRWVASPSCLDYAQTANRMAIVPNIMNKANVLGSEEQIDRGSPFSIYQEPIHVQPLYGGNLADGLKYKVAIYTALAWAQTNTDAVVRSGSLTFTAP